MVSALPDVFTEAEYPLAWLSAARLRGELRQSGPAYVPAWSPDTFLLRAQSVSWLIPTGYIASGLTAAWVHGVVPWRYPVTLSYRTSGRRPQSFDPTLYRVMRLSTEHNLCMRVSNMDLTGPAQTAFELWLRRQSAHRTEAAPSLAVIRMLLAKDQNWRATLARLATRPHHARAATRLQEALSSHQTPAA